MTVWRTFVIAREQRDRGNPDDTFFSSIFVWIASLRYFVTSFLVPP